MLTQFSLTFDSFNRSLTLVTGERIIHDIDQVHLTRSEAGGYECSVTRTGKGKPVRLVAGASAEGKVTLAAGNARESAEVPGFVEAAVQGNVPARLAAVKHRFKTTDEQAAAFVASSQSLTDKQFDAHIELLAKTLGERVNPPKPSETKRATAAGIAELFGYETEQ